MKGNPVSAGNRAGIAVIRGFQPVCIERELLAQVFDLVRRGIDQHYQFSADEHKSAVIFRFGRTAGPLDTPIFGVDGESHLAELENAA